MSATAAPAGWLVAAGLALALVVLRRRLDRVGDAEHELRGAITALALRTDRPGRSPSAELARARTALDDLTAARRGGHAARSRGRPTPLEPLVASTAAAWGVAAGGVELDWRAGRAAAVADAGRVAQVLGNVVSNAVEHGAGAVRIEARRVGGAVRVEVVNRASSPRPPRVRRRRTGADRGRGLRIASRAARDAGGSLRLVGGRDAVAAVVDLPVQP